MAFGAVFLLLYSAVDPGHELGDGFGGGLQLESQAPDSAVPIPRRHPVAKRSARPDARATGRSTAARMAASLATTVSRSLARVTPV